MTNSTDETRKRGLGRGLSALFGDEEGPSLSETVTALNATEAEESDSAAMGPDSIGQAPAFQDPTGQDPTGQDPTGQDPTGQDFTGQAPTSQAPRSVPIEFLRPNPTQPRKRFDESAIDGLVDSIRRQGILQPLLVRPHPDEANAYEIVAGERRWRAAQRAQLHDVPIVIKPLSDTETLEIALIENIHREDLTALEEAEGYQRLMEEFGHTQEALSKAVGKSRSHIANMLRLIALPEALKSMLDDGLLSIGHARALLPSPNAETLAHEVIKKGYNVRQTERLVQDHKPDAEKTHHGMDTLKTRIDSTSPPTEERDPNTKDPNTRAMEQSLSDMLGMQVSIELESSGSAGLLTVSFSDLDQLDDVIERLNSKKNTASTIVEM